VEHAASAPIVVLSPHLDDAVLSAWSVLTEAREVVVVNVFAGLPQPGPPPRWDLMAGARERREHMQDRLEEDRAALALGKRSAVYLPFLDGQYRTDAPTPTELSSAIGGAVGAASTLYAPAGIGSHADHLLVRRVAVELSRRIRLPLNLYAELPYAVRFGWPSWVSGAPADPRLVADADWEPVLGSTGLPRAALEPRVRRLDDDQMAAKLTAMKRYRTQFPLLNHGPHRLLEHRLVLPWEVTWSVEQGLH
jgi:LmbE family N-acetylglucosaminyl deacetylase